jgi:hypothetical protein
MKYTGHTGVDDGFDGDGAIRDAQGDTAAGRGDVQPPGVVGAEDVLRAREASV